VGRLDKIVQGKVGVGGLTSKLADKVHGKLKHGHQLICPKCGGREFGLNTQIWFTDYLRSNEDGNATVTCTNVNEVTAALSIDDVGEILCVNCDTEIPKKWLDRIPKDKVEYT
jgi:hypothetical protein